jgi:hypothetical protein
MYINMKSSKELVNKLVKETLEQKYTNASASWSDLIDELSKEIKKPIELDDAGNYNVCECEPYHISIRPIVHGICDVQVFKDYSDRTKKLFMKFEDVKKFVKEYLTSKDLNYVDSALSKPVDNSKDKQGGTSADKKEDMEHMVDFKDNYKVIKNIKAEPMNKEIDNPTEPMQVVGKFLKSSEYKSVNPKYTPPPLPKALQKLVVKYTKAGKAKKK